MTVTAATTAKIAAELAWLKDNPHFRERPATLIEFLGPDYLNIEDGVRERIKEVLADIMGHEVDPRRPTAYELAIFTGAIGIGKTTVASIVLPYLVHWVLCLKDPQDYFELLPGSRIAFMMMSTKASQAKEVLFGDVKARIAHSPWFKNFPIDPNFKNQIRFEGDPAKGLPGDIWILPGDSLETTFEGFNILGGIIDEADSHKVTDDKDYAAEGFRTIYNRISSRFGNRGHLMIIGQMKKSTGFAARKYEEFLKREDAYACRLTIWESRGDTYYQHPDRGDGEKFYYDVKRKQIVPNRVISALGDTSHLTHIPILYIEQFRNNPEEALKDLAGIPPAVESPFISLVDLIFACRERWIENYGSPGPVDQQARIESGWRACDTLPRVAHIDIGYSGNGDALGFAMGHVRSMTEIDGELKPHIVIDLLYRLRAAPGQEIMIGDIRRFIYHLRDDLGYKITEVTMDGFQSKDTEQQLNRKSGLTAYYLSVDKEKAPYHDLREAIYEKRLEFPPYEVEFKAGGPEGVVDIACKELMELMDLGRKIDHPVGGSKDVSDSIAAVVSNLMGNTRFHRKRRGSDLNQMATPLASPFTSHRLVNTSPISHHAYRGGAPGAPIPPSIGTPR